LTGPFVPRLLATGSVVTSATAFRIGLGCLELWAERTPPLIKQALKASAGESKAQAAFRDDLIALARDATEQSWRELRRCVDDFDRFTRSGDEEPGERPHRPYRVKL
jgi:hypothetical protein